MEAYQGKVVPRIRVEEHKKKTLLAIYEGKNVCSSVVTSCHMDRYITCDICAYNNHREAIPMEWYIANGYFTKEDMLEALLDKDT